ncbi:MAG: hypothetical protein EZS26_002395 [Candidatus Ordinivivax streblomastigis]|uniref:TonB-dependent receptor plug domain-containing protein n=1 Tax=Candidatus Ordinivivax streblomastigis TaxID=2540710 RepID=A0A5M8NZ29_9BACT|nr:MAG: hypothetical protein EZS26_002395 [Candidatus Ordinivivax streblomastigis]
MNIPKCAPVFGFWWLLSFPTFSQTVAVDTVSWSLDIKEVVVTGKQGIDHNRQVKPISSVEEYLQTSEKVNMIKRGGYAWEATINNMTSERIAVTIDGMKIFSACTDKMDPVTSYVETINLSKVSIGSGFSGAPNASNNIGGSLDLQLNKSGFGGTNWDAQLNSGYESNGNYLVEGVSGAYSDANFYTNAGLFYRHSDNYDAGGRKELPFSQFTKKNVFTNLGYKPASGHIIESTVIYDIASDVGYPALTMDVSTAEGFITSLSYRREDFSRIFSKWETKIYYNRLTHIMDDTHRPNVVLHMDMPGKSRTSGVYSTLNGLQGQHRYIFNWDLYDNRSYAEMTMYPTDPTEIPMFMLTWPDIRTLNSGLFASDEYRLDERNTIRLSSKISIQRSSVESSSGLKTLQIYHSGMQPSNNRLVWNVAGQYQFRTGGWELAAEGGYGMRAPASSEAYGYFLNNTFDGYDYLGSPRLRNERSIEGNLALGWKSKTISMNIEATGFYFTDYIIGKPDATLSPMTIGASGVKVYQNLPHALMGNTSVSFRSYFLDYFGWKSRITYSIGRDNNGASLPLISPLSGATSLSFNRYPFSAEISMDGAARQVNFSPEYGEDSTAAYLIGNFSLGYSFRIKATELNVKAGIENLFDTYYSTYSDWKNIPRKGRNIFINLGIAVL